MKARYSVHFLLSLYFKNSQIIFSQLVWCLIQKKCEGHSFCLFVEIPYISFKCNSISLFSSYSFYVFFPFVSSSWHFSFVDFSWIPLLQWKWNMVMVWSPFKIGISGASFWLMMEPNTQVFFSFLIFTLCPFLFIYKALYFLKHSHLGLSLSISFSNMLWVFL